MDISKEIINQEESKSNAVIEFEKAVSQDGQLLDNPELKAQPSMGEVETEEEYKKKIEK